MNPDAAASTEWRSQLPLEARSRVVNKIMDTLKKHLPISGPEGIRELNKIAVRFEEKIFSGATSQADYLRKISMKMISMEQKTHGNNGAANSVDMSSNILNQISPYTGLEMRSCYQGDWWCALDEELYSGWGSGWRPPQRDPNMNPDAAASTVWQSQIQPEARSRIVTKIMDTLKKHLPICGPEDLDKLKKIVVWFEENVFSKATSQADYLRIISLKMLCMEQKIHGNGVANALAASSN